MKLIEKLCDLIDEELGDAEKYAKLALKYREERPAVAEMFHDLSTDEMRHMNMLHGKIVAVIDEYRKQKGEPPAEMTVLYDYLHNKQIERAHAVRACQSAFRSG